MLVSDSLHGHALRSILAPAYLPRPGSLRQHDQGIFSISVVDGAGYAASAVACSGAWRGVRAAVRQGSGEAGRA